MLKSPELIPIRFTIKKAHSIGSFESMEWAKTVLQSDFSYKGLAVTGNLDGVDAVEGDFLFHFIATFFPSIIFTPRRGTVSRWPLRLYTAPALPSLAGEGVGERLFSSLILSKAA